MTTKVVRISAAEALIAEQLTYWISVAQAGKGGSRDDEGRGWSYLAASDLQERIFIRSRVDLSLKTIYRALKSLCDRGWFDREMKTKHLWKHVWHYALGKGHPDQENRIGQNDQVSRDKADASKTKNSPNSSSTKSITAADIRPSDSQQASSLCSQTASAPPINEEEVASQPLTSIKDSAPPELLEELKTIEANYRKQLESLKAPELSPVAVKEPPEVPRVPSAEHSKQDSGLEHRIHNPQLEQGTRRAHNPKVGNTWDRIRALASQFSASTVDQVSPKAIITRSNQRLRVDDGVTAPLR